MARPGNEWFKQGLFKHMTSKEIMAWNRQAKAHGVRVCPTCLNVYDFTPDNWVIYTKKINGKDCERHRPNCYTCERLIDSERDRKRYRNNPESRDKIKAHCRAYHKKRRKRTPEENAERYRRAKLKRLNQLLGKE